MRKHAEKHYLQKLVHSSLFYIKFPLNQTLMYKLKRSFNMHYRILRWQKWIFKIDSKNPYRCQSLPTPLSIPPFTPGLKQNIVLKDFFLFFRSSCSDKAVGQTEERLLAECNSCGHVSLGTETACGSIRKPATEKGHELLTACADDQITQQTLLLPHMQKCPESTWHSHLMR